MNQLNLFGDDMIKVTNKEEEQQKEKDSTKKKSTSAKGNKETTKPATPKKKQEIKVFSDWTIHYYGHSFSVTEFVQDIPDSGITTETLRESMVLEFFEMTKERTQFDQDVENKRLFPKITGGAKG